MDNPMRFMVFSRNSDLTSTNINNSSVCLSVTNGIFHMLVFKNCLLTLFKQREGLYYSLKSIQIESEDKLSKYSYLLNYMKIPMEEVKFVKINLLNIHFNTFKLWSIFLLGKISSLQNLKFPDIWIILTIMGISNENAGLVEHHL